jgi:signal transduction histidine kinase
MTRPERLVLIALIIAIAALVLLSLLVSPALALLTGISAMLTAGVIVLLEQRRASRRAEVLARQVAAREAELETVWQVGTLLGEAQDRKQLTQAVVSETRRLLGAEAAAFCLCASSTSCHSRRLNVQGVGGLADAFDVSSAGCDLQFPASDACCPVVQAAFRVGQLRQPIARNGEVLACLCVASRQPTTDSARERDLLGYVATQTAAALERIEQIERVTASATAVERERLAREIHDTLTQSLGWASFNAQSIQEYLSRGQLAAAQTQLDKQIALSRALYNDARGLLMGLRTNADTPLVPAIRDYANRFSEWSGITTIVDGEDFGDVRLPPDVELQLLRVAQEALSNVRKHAQAKRIYIAFHRDQSCAEMTISDDGQGMVLDSQLDSGAARFGMRSMRERMEALGGTLNIHSLPGRGSIVHARIPIVYCEGDQV